MKYNGFKITYMNKQKMCIKLDKIEKFKKIRGKNENKIK